MTEDIGTYKFDFEKEVIALRSDLPDSPIGSVQAHGENMLFAEMGAGGSQDKRKVYLNRILGSEEKKRAWSETIEQVIQKRTKESSFYQLLEKGRSFWKKSAHLVSFIDGSFEALAVTESDKSAFRLFVFYHETAHALADAKPADVDDDHPYHEHLGDAYAAIRLLQRFGREAVPLLSMISWHRSFEAMGSGETAHLTTLTLDKIIADSATEDFSKLSQTETIIRAAQYAQDWTPKPHVLSGFREVTKETDNLDLTELLSTTCLSSSAFRFYIGAKFFQPFLVPGGMEYNGEMTGFKEDKREEIGRKLQKHAGNRSLRDALDLKEEFGSAASERPLPMREALEMPLPPGRKHHVFKA